MEKTIEPGIIQEEKEIEEYEVFEMGSYHVVLWNDNVTPLLYVIVILAEVFGLNESEAVDKALDAHMNGSAIVAEYRFETAVEKVKEAMDKAKEYHCPEIKFTVEK